MPEYHRPGRVTRTIMGTPIALAARLGLSIGGANSLTVRGAVSGKARTVPVNPLAFEGANYLVAPRGDTHWARNLRTAGEGDLRLGRRNQRIRVTELPDGEKPAVIAAYLDRWGNITRSHFGATDHPDAEELQRLASRTPVFKFTTSTFQ